MTLQRSGGSSFGGSSIGGSGASSVSAGSRRRRATKGQEDGTRSDDLVDRRSPFEAAVFGVLFTLSKENSETRIRIRWILLKILLDGWQLFSTVVQPGAHGWDINQDGRAWAVVGVLNFTWLADLGYGAYLALLYSMVVLLGINVGLCVWVAWCFKEQKFPVVWPIKVLQVFTAFFFHAFDVASLNLLQLGISCRYGGPAPKMHFDLMPEYSCVSPPHLIHAVVSALSLILFVAIAMLLNMAEVEVNPLSRRPFALGHSGSEVAAFGIRVLLTSVNVFFPWPKVASCLYLLLAVALAWQYLRHPGHLVQWVNDLKAGVSIAIVWCSLAGVLLVFRPGVSADGVHAWAHAVTVAMLAGLGPAFGVGALWSRLTIKRMTRIALDALATKDPNTPLQDVCDNLDDPRDVEVVARCCRTWLNRYNVAPEGIEKAQAVIKAGLAMFPSSAYMVLLHANFMIDVLGVSQSGGRRIEGARKLNPSLMCRFIMFVRQQQATQRAAGHSANDGASMDLLGYVEYQRKQRMVVRLHRDALQAMCAFWKALDAHTVSFTRMARLLSKIEGSVSQAQTAYRVVLEHYGSSPKLVRLYGKFLEGCKYDPWGAQEYYTEADRLEEAKSGIASGPLLPDGTPLSRMDDMAVGVLVINAAGEVQMANKMAYTMFGYKRGTLDSKPLVMLLAPHSTRTLVDILASLVAASSRALAAAAEGAPVEAQPEAVVVAMHYDRVAFSVKLSIRKASGVGEDSTFITLWEPLPPLKGVATLWVAPNGDVAACDPQFVSITGWKASEVHGASVSSFLSMPAAQGPAAAASDEESAGAACAQQSGHSGAEMVARLLAQPAPGGLGTSLPCFGVHKFLDDCPLACSASIVHKDASVAPIYELRIRLIAADAPLLMVVNRAGAIKYASLDLVASLRDSNATAAGGPRAAGGVRPGPIGGAGGGSAEQALLGAVTSSTDQLALYTLSDFLLPHWKELHVKLLKDATATAAPSRSPLGCRKGAAGQQGPTQELRTLGGKPLYMHVAVAATDMMGEMVHVVRMSRSSLETCLSERRLRLRISSDGLITEISKETPASLFGLDPSTVVGRGLYELVDESLQGEGDGPRLKGDRSYAALVQRALTYPGHSWRVQVAPPTKSTKGAALTLSAAARISRVKPAIMQVHVEDALEGDTGAAEDAAEFSVIVDLWPTAFVTGVLSVDGQGRVTAVLEEATRPAGLLFGLPSQSLVGETLDALLELPAERSTPADLMTSLGAKKSNLRSSKHSGVKVGPTHVLRGSHSDGRGPVQLSVQLVGKPEPNEPATVLLRLHATPLAPALLPGAQPGLVPAPGAPPPWAYPSPIGASRRGSQLGASGSPAAAAAAGTPRRVTTQDPFSLGARDGTSAVPGSRRGRAEASPLVRMASTARREGSTDIAMFIMPPSSDPAAPAMKPCGAGSPTDERALRLSAAVAKLQGSAPAGRDRLGNLVKPLGLNRSSSATGEQLRMPSSRASTPSGLRVTGYADRQVGADGEPNSPPATPAPGGVSDFEQGLDPAQPGIDGDLGGEAPASTIMRQRSALSARPGEARKCQAKDLVTEPCDGARGEDDSDSSASGEPQAGAQRISTWVTSKGAFYQNAAPSRVGSDVSRVSDDDDEASAVPLAALLLVPPPLVLNKGTEGASLAAAKGGDGARTTSGAHAEHGHQDDDAASEGGNSNRSGTGGAEYKRGKRFRKLAKMLDSGAAQQALQRLRVHALWVVSLLAVVHVVCFVMTTVAVKEQQKSMLAIGRAGQSQRFMHLIMTDTRSLDVISRNMTVGSETLPSLYNASSVPFLLQRISESAEEVKTRFNEILASNSDTKSPIMELLYYTSRSVFNGVDSNGTDLFINITVWDFTTRFCSLAKSIEASYEAWQGEGVHVADTFAGQFLIKSGPDIFRASRKVFDALLYQAVDNSRAVKLIQYVFLAVEGGAITCLAACYLAYLLRAVAVQRYKLYGTFLAVPMGLTRALATENANLVEQDDDEGGDDQEEEDNAKEAATPSDVPAGEEKLRHRARLAGDEGSDDRLRRVTSVVSAKDVGLMGRRETGIPADDTAAKKENFRSSSSQHMTDGHGGRGGSWRAFSSRIKGLLGGPRSGSRGVLPASSAPGASSASNKRSLKADSHDTGIMLLPFVLWSVLVIIFYAVAVSKLEGVVEAVAVHSVTNYISARTMRAVFFSQELAVVQDPALLESRRANLRTVAKLVRDAWYTLQLGSDAYLASGNDTERFPLVKVGVAYASPRLTRIFYENGHCHRAAEHLPCLGPAYRYAKEAQMGVDSIMNRYMQSLVAMSTNTSTTPLGLGDADFHFVYSLGSQDLLDGTREINAAHYDTVLTLFDGVLSFHVVLFVLLWVIFSAWIVFLLNPLCKRVAKERRRIAELMSQLPLELDVARLVSRALGTSTSAGRRISVDTAVISAEFGPGLDGQSDAAKWKSIIRTASSLAGNKSAPGKVRGSLTGLKLQ